MVVDVGVVKNHIKPKADSTLYNMRKVDLIEYVRTLEHNYNVAVSFNENQAKYIESLEAVPVVHGRWGRKNWLGEFDYYNAHCSECGYKIGTSGWSYEWKLPYCPSCGAKMDGERSEGE